MTPKQRNTVRRLVVPSLLAIFAIAGLVAVAAGDPAKLLDLATASLLTLMLGAAVTTDQLLERGDVEFGGGPVAASTILYQGTMTFINSSGYYDDDTASGANAFGGMVRIKVDNSAGASGDKKVETFRDGQFKLIGTGFTQADLGKRVYASDNYTVSLSSAGNVFCGVISEYMSATEVFVDIECGSTGATAPGVAVNKTADYTVTPADNGKTFTTVGATGTVTFALPPATVGLRNQFRVGAAQELRVDPNGTETIALPSTGVQGAAGKYLTANADGETLSIECTVAGQWSVMGYTGTWTQEA